MACHAQQRLSKKKRNKEKCQLIIVEGWDFFREFYMNFLDFSTILCALGLG